jgi:pimeloyl-ACP methyl ester carboxylesterase
MWGPSELTARGTLRDLDLTPRLGELALPVLFVCGEHDEAPPATTRAYARLVPDSEVAVITGAAHVATYDRPEEAPGARGLAPASRSLTRTP